jgi:hypothetical protein
MASNFQRIACKLQCCRTQILAIRQPRSEGRVELVVETDHTTGMVSEVDTARVHHPNIRVT